jgi:hypothetical protein
MESGKEGGETGWGDGGGFIGRERGRRGSRGRRGGVGGGEIVEGVEMAEVVEPWLEGGFGTNAMALTRGATTMLVVGEREREKQSENRWISMERDNILGEYQWRERTEGIRTKVIINALNENSFSHTI